MEDIKFEKYDGNQQLVWDTSSLTTFQACPYKYQLNNLERYTVDSAVENAKKNWGHAYHAGQEARSKVLFEGGSRQEALSAAIGAVLPYKDILNDSDDNRRTLETVVRALVWYDEQYPPAEDSVRTAAMPDGSPAIEVRFEIAIPGTDRRMSGRIDRLVHDQEGNLYISDHKTTNQSLGPYFFGMYFPDNQVFTYIYACRRVLEMPVHGFMFDACQTLVGSNRFDRRFFDVTDTQLDWWLDSIKRDIEQAKEYAEDGYFPPKFSGCNMYGGCPYKRVCSRPPEFHEQWLEFDFVKRD